jgi:hypothetical protein
MGVTELKRLRALEDENAQLKKLVADLSLCIPPESRKQLKG